MKIFCNTNCLDWCMNAWMDIIWSVIFHMSIYFFPHGLHWMTHLIHVLISGYQWWKSQKIGNAKTLKVNPKEKFTVLGSCFKQVDHIWIVESNHNSMSGSLVDLAKQRIKSRDSPSFQHFDEYKKVRQSCWIIEESEGDF